MLKIHNNSDLYACFKIKTTRPESYLVRPNSGCVPPHNAQEIRGGDGRWEAGSVGGLTASAVAHLPVSPSAVSMISFDKLDVEHEKHKFLVRVEG